MPVPRLIFPSSTRNSPIKAHPLRYHKASLRPTAMTLMTLLTKTPIRGCHLTFNKGTSVESTTDQSLNQELDDDTTTMPSLLDSHLYSDDDSSRTNSVPSIPPPRDYHSDQEPDLPQAPMFNIFIPTTDPRKQPIYIATHKPMSIAGLRCLYPSLTT
jgi:hypothetical protein